MASSVWSFPNPVNEKAARTVAAGVAVLTTFVLVTQWWWLTPVLAVGFLARVVSGPTLSPLGQLATRVVAPRLGPPREVPGPPKRFAQSIGLAVERSIDRLASLAREAEGATDRLEDAAIFGIVVGRLRREEADVAAPFVEGCDQVDVVTVGARVRPGQGRLAAERRLLDRRGV